MKCIICLNEDIVLTKVFEEIQIGNDIVRVPVEVLVCKNCGERYYDRKTMRYLEDIEVKIRNKKDYLREVGKILELD